MRNHLNGGDVWDQIHIALATERVPHAALRYFWDGNPITGVFDKRTKMKGAAEARGRLHFLGFVDDRVYQDPRLHRRSLSLAIPTCLAQARK